ncbi:universal stress protein [Dokdonella fugitiva]|uniref:Nucleotide-binding universal stress UspA family protein n=1 Tax=Dokdonella fugitiva TaxID=328517 RepID=A0A4R2I7F6_9GAMM|nr:universal stress protein [Dokdonella fugitiva]TCO40234.1 nucleotide-binding universal stress UspA family protein [Dokdonella fugitiva]
MFEHILIPTDGSKLSEKAVRKGIRFAHAMNARVTAFHAIPRFHASDVMMDLLGTSRGDYAKAAQAYANERLRFVQKAARALDVPCDARHATTDDPAGAIIEAAKANGCDLILMASHGRRGLGALLLGSETQKVLTHSTIPVLVYR